MRNSNGNRLNIKFCISTVYTFIFGNQMAIKTLARRNSLYFGGLGEVLLHAEIAMENEQMEESEDGWKRGKPEEGRKRRKLEEGGRGESRKIRKEEKIRKRGKEKEIRSRGRMWRSQKELKVDKKQRKSITKSELSLESARTNGSSNSLERKIKTGVRNKSRFLLINFEIIAETQ